MQTHQGGGKGGPGNHGNAIRWPEAFRPERVGVHVRNELDMPVGPEAVWAWLVRAERWPSWYPNAKNVRYLNPVDGAGPDLQLGTRFRWSTFGVSIESLVEEFVPNERIAWSARGLGLHVYHAWLIERTPGGCHVLTEETQNGFVARLGSFLLPARMYRFHQIWLERLQAKALCGPPV